MSNDRPDFEIALLLLAAGGSRRMGRPKALLEWQGGTVIRHHYDQFKNLGVFDPWIVMQPDDLALSCELDYLGWPSRRRVVNIRAPECEMLESITCGMRAVLGDSSTYGHIGIALVDQMKIKSSTLAILAGCSAECPDKIIQPEFNGRRGHPVFLPRAVAEELAGYGGPTLRNFLNQYKALRMPIILQDEGIITDMDTPESYYQQFSNITGESHAGTEE